MDQKWTKREISNNRTILNSKLIDDDPRNFIYEENYEIREYGITKNSYNGIEQLQFWIDTNEYDETEKIKEFNEKCKYWNFGKYVDNKVILSLDDVIFDRFEFVKDEKESYILRYNEEKHKKEPYIKSNIESFEVEFNERFNKKYIKFQYNDDNMLLFDFIKKFDEKIQKIIKEDKNNYNIDIQQYNYLSCIKEDDYQNNNYIELKIKNPYIESKNYNNAIIYIKPNILWNINYLKKGEDTYSWGVSLTVDKIIEN